MDQQNIYGIGRPVEFNNPKQASFYVESDVLQQFDKDRGNIPRGRYIQILMEISKKDVDRLNKEHDLKIEKLKKQLTHLNNVDKLDENEVMSAYLENDAVWAKNYKPDFHDPGKHGASKNWWNLAEGKCLKLENETGFKLKPHDYIELINRRLQK